jgi:hypothetical protein
MEAVNVTEQWIRDNLPVEADEIILSAVQRVPIATFLAFFGASEPTHAALSGSHTFQWGDPPQELTHTAAELGYQQFFDGWRDAGIIT